jgi:hypothetical protein
MPGGGTSPMREPGGNTGSAASAAAARARETKIVNKKRNSMPAL